VPTVARLPRPAIVDKKTPVPIEPTVTENDYSGNERESIRGVILSVENHPFQWHSSASRPGPGSVTLRAVRNAGGASGPGSDNLGRHGNADRFDRVSGVFPCPEFGRHRFGTVVVAAGRGRVRMGSPRIWVTDTRDGQVGLGYEWQPPADRVAEFEQIDLNATA